MIETFGIITAYHDMINARYNPQEFVGRKWLIGEVVRFRDDEERRHLVIVGEPGSGKSTFLAYLAAFWNCPRHFIRVDNRSGVAGIDPRAFLVSLGAQLYEKYGLDIFERGIAGHTQVTVGWTKDQAEVVGRFVDELYTLPFLPLQRDDVQVKVGVAAGHSKVLGEQVRRLVDVTLALDELTLLHVALINPLHKIQELHPDEKVVILVDALDESIHHAGTTSILDVLPLPTDAEFPPNLRMVMTSRNGSHLSRYHLSDLLDLDDKKKGYWQESQQDTRSYIEKRLAESPFTEMTATWKQGEVDDYIVQVIEHSQNNFLYLYFFFEELAASIGTNQVDVHSFGIPKGLNEIYRSFAVEKIRKNVEDVVQFTVLGEIPLSLHPQLKAKPTISNVEVSGQEVMMTTTDGDRVMFLLSGWLHNIGIQTTIPHLQKAEQLGVWEEKCLPILGVMAVAYEPLCRDLIAGFAGVEVIYVDSVLAQIRQFLDEIVYEQANAYQFYHTSFSEYLLDSQRNRDYPLDALAYHYQVASYYRGKSTSWDEVAWSTIKESYPFNYLVAHLAASGYGEEVHCLLASETKQQRNTWFEVKEARGNIAGYLADVNQAWKLTEASGALIQSTQKRGQAIGRQCRYALITGSIRNLAGNVPTALLIALVENKVWLPIRGQVYAMQMLNEWQRAEALVKLAPTLPQPLVREVWAAAKVWKDTDTRTEVLVGLAPYLSEPQRAQALQEALAAVRAIDDMSRRTRALAELAPSLPEPLQTEVLQEALAATREEDGYSQVQTLLELASHLPEALMLEALAAAQAIEDERLRAQALAGLVPALPKPLVQEAWAAVVMLEDTDDRADALAKLAPHLPEPLLRAHALEEFLVIARAIRDEYKRAQAIIELAPHLSELQSREALAVARTIDDGSWRAQALIELVPHLSEVPRAEVLREVLDVAAGVHMWAETLGKLASYLSAPQWAEILEKALAAALATGSEYWRAKAWAELAPSLPEPLQTEVLQEALATVRAIDDEREQTWVLEELVPHLSSIPLLREALAVTQAMRFEQWKTVVLTMLVPHLPKQLLQEALVVARMMGDADLRMRVLIMLAPHLPEPLLRETLAAVQTRRGANARARLLPSLPESLRSIVLEEALAAIRASGEKEYWKARALVGLASTLSQSLVQEAWAVAMEMENPYPRIQALGSLAPYLTEPQRAQVWQEALAAIRAPGEKEYWQIQALAELIPFLSEPLPTEVLQEALAAVRTIEDGFWRMQALIKLAPHLPEPLLREALVAVQTRRDADTRAKQMQSLSELQQRETLQEALTAVRAIKDERQRAKNLADLVPSLLEPQRTEVLQEALAAARTMLGEEYMRVEIQAKLVPYLPEPQRTEVLQEALAAARAIENRWGRAVPSRAEVLSWLAPYLAHLSTTTSFPLWCETLHVLAVRSRRDLLADMSALIPLIEALEGKEALVATAQAIIEVGKWFP